MTCRHSCSQQFTQPDLDIWVAVHAVDHCVVYIVGGFPPGGPYANAGIHLQTSGTRFFNGADLGQPRPLSTWLLQLSSMRLVASSVAKQATLRLCLSGAMESTQGGQLRTAVRVAHPPQKVT